MTLAPRLTRRLVDSYLSALDCPRSLAAWMMFSYGEHLQLANLECDPNDYLDGQSFRDAYLATKFLSKATFLKTNIDLKAVALQKFSEAEIACATTNRKSFAPSGTYSRGLESLYFTMIRKIRWILGRFDAEEWIEHCNWGPGVTLELKDDTSDVNKYRREVDATASLLRFMQPLMQAAYPSWNPILRKVMGNNVVTVPKNAKTDRVIAIEPGINLWFQKGLGSQIRRRLKRHGIDLNHGQARNQELARVSSITGTNATVDFSSASDMISRELIRSILPDDWIFPLDMCRSAVGTLSDVQFEYEKFSSMGNGFTFELETLIFYAAALTCCQHCGCSSEDVSVYGDDVIIPVPAYEQFRTLVEDMGFTINSKKTFHNGYFRESCGAHYFKGYDCKPFYLKKVITDESEIYQTANSIRRTSHRSHYYGCDRRFLRSWQLLFDSVKRKLYVSEGYGDGGFIVNFDEACPPRARNGIEGYYSSVLIFRQRKYFCDDHALLLARVRRGSTDMSYGNDVPVKSRGKYVRKRILIPRWYDLGPWWY